MRIKQLYENVFVEINKTQALNLLLDDFNYYLNKAIQQFANKWYNFAEMSQVVDDNLRVLKSPTTAITVTENDKVPVEWGDGNQKVLGDTYRLRLPDDYMHILNCVCAFKYVTA